MRGEPDQVLVGRVLAGDSDAYAGLVTRYRDNLGRYATRMLGNEADAEEALQDAFLRGYRSLHRCKAPEKFGAWLFGILVNRCRTYGARNQRRGRFIVSDEIAVNNAAVSHTEEQDAWRETIEWALHQLPDDQREAFLLKHVEGLSYEAMSELTATGVSALKMRVLRAREQLVRLVKVIDRDE